jgi:geranylgeranyl pyrophosphate synthase
VESQVKVLEGEMLKPFARARANNERRFRRLDENRAGRIGKRLSGFLPAADVIPTKLHEAMRYALLGGGKRVRPLLVYAAGALFGADAATLAARRRRWK